MTKGFWGKLKKPIMILAPMANVTDVAFRSMIAKYGKPDVMYTEFVSVDGLLSSGSDKIRVDLQFSEAERPIVAQIFGSKPDNFRKAAKLITDMGFDGIDINMGCPDRSVEKQGAGSALIKNPRLAQEIILAAKEGAPDLPVSVKTRIGYNKVSIDEWLSVLLEVMPAAIIFHARTRKEMSKVPAHWEMMKQVVDTRNKLDLEKNTLIIGNGDVMDLEEARKKVDETGVDGVMLGRGIFGNPWLFNGLRSTSPNQLSAASEVGNFSYSRRGKNPTVEERLKVMVEHSKLFEQYFTGIKKFETMKKHYKAYVNNFDGAKELRVKLMEEAESSTDVERIIKDYLATSAKSA